MCPVLAFGRTLTAAGRRRAFVASLLITLMAHLLLVLGLPLFERRSATASGIAPEAKPAAPDRPDRKDLQFVLVDTQKAEEEADPRKAVARAARSSRASEQAPDLSLPPGPPRADGASRILPSLIGPGGAPSQPVTPSPLTDQRQSQQRQALARPAPKAELQPRHEERQPHPDGILDPARALADRAAAEARAANGPRPKVIDIRKAQQKPGAPGANQASRTRARLFESRAMELLRARYPEYFAKLLELWSQSVARQSSIAHSSHRTGSIVVRVAIEADGRIGELAVVYAEDGMLPERNFTVASIRDAGPFPPLTERMQRDPLFKAVTFQMLFY